MVSLEVCANSITSALAAQNGGAVRVELCDNLYAGGTTPSPGQITAARKLLHIKLYVLVRPRGGDFLYTDTEFETMLTDVKYCIEAGCDGIVIGILKADGSIDKERCTQLINLAKQAGIGTTFHRAFDMCANQFQALEEIIEMGFERILTSGGNSTAMDGAEAIAALVKKADGRISIMAGSGISEANVADLVRATDLTEVHGTLLVREKSHMQYFNEQIVMGRNYADEYAIEITGVERVKQVVANANSAA